MCWEALCVPVWIMPGLRPLDVAYCQVQGLPMLMGKWGHGGSCAKTQDSCHRDASHGSCGISKQKVAFNNKCDGRKRKHQKR